MVFEEVDSYKSLDELKAFWIDYKHSYNISVHFFRAILEKLLNRKLATLGEVRTELEFLSQNIEGYLGVFYSLDVGYNQYFRE